MLCPLMAAVELGHIVSWKTREKGKNYNVACEQSPLHCSLYSFYLALTFSSNIFSLPPHTGPPWSTSVSVSLSSSSLVEGGHSQPGLKCSGQRSWGWEACHCPWVVTELTGRSSAGARCHLPPSLLPLHPGVEGPYHQLAMGYCPPKSCQRVLLHSCRSASCVCRKMRAPPRPTTGIQLLLGGGSGGLRQFSSPLGPCPFQC